MPDHIADGEADRIATGYEPPDRLLPLKAVKQISGLGKTMIYQLEREGKFPKRFKPGGVASRWSEREILEWKEGCPPHAIFRIVKFIRIMAGASADRRRECTRTIPIDATGVDSVVAEERCGAVTLIRSPRGNIHESA